MEHVPGTPSDENVADPAMAQAIVDSSQRNGGLLVKLDRKAFDLDGQVEPAAMKGSVMAKIACGLPD